MQGRARLLPGHCRPIAGLHALDQMISGRALDAGQRALDAGLGELDRGQCPLDAGPRPLDAGPRAL